MSKIHVRKLLSDLVAVIKEKTGLTSFTWGELEFLLKYYCAPEEKIDISPMVNGSCSKVIVPRGITNCSKNWYLFYYSRASSIIFTSDVSIISSGLVPIGCSLYFVGCSEIPTLNDAGTSCFPSAIYVPSSMVSMWKTATNWSTYADKIKSLNQIEDKENYKKFINSGVNLILKNGVFTWDEFKTELKKTFEITKDNSLAVRFYNRETTDEDLTLILKGASKIISYSFVDCMQLKSVKIPSGITLIDRYAFYGCKSLVEIDFSTHTAVPTLGSADAFNNTSSSLAIKVPLALLDEWKAATNWSTYADKIVGV